jgi:endonuclease YncB( thermonuclease family)
MALQSRERARGHEGWPSIAAVGAATIVLYACLGLPVAAADLPAALEEGGTARVMAVIDGDTLTLQDGRIVRLLGIAAAKPPLTARADRRWPLAERATSLLTELGADQEVHLGFGGRRTDRYGRLLVQLYRADGLWLEGELLSHGLARVVSHPDNRAMVPEMLALEAQARQARRGLWATRGFAVLDPREARRHLDSFELVEGSIESIARVGGKDCLRMGHDPRDGLTAVLLPESKHLFKAASLVPASYEGKRVRVRGFVRWWNGPIIEVSHPEQIEILTP